MLLNANKLGQEGNMGIIFFFSILVAVAVHVTLKNRKGVLQGACFEFSL